MNLLAASTLAYLNDPLSSALKGIQEMGFTGVEIYHEGEHHLSSHEIHDELSSYDLEVFFHAPFSDLNLASFNETVLRESKKQIKASLKTAADVGARGSTVHFGRYSPLGLSDPEGAKRLNIASISEISSYAKDIGIQISFENGPKGFGIMYGSLSTITELTKEEDIKITLDVGHAHTWEHAEIFVRELRSSITHVHLHDNPGDADMHLPMGEGMIDYKRVFRAFKEVNYNNAWSLELLQRVDLEKSKSHLESVLEDM